ncbi:MAG: hypothetical protein R3C01_06345 [Planctomycetaceae bacterium]
MIENQPRQALVHLDKLEKSHPSNGWVAVTRSRIQMMLEESLDAKISLLRFLKSNPDHARANAMYALASMSVDGIPACKKAVNRALKRSVADSPAIVGTLLESLGQHHQMEVRPVAALAHYRLAIPLAEHQETFWGLTQRQREIQSNPWYPLFLRSDLTVPQFETPDHVVELVDRAEQLSHLGCWDEAALLIQEAVTKEPQSAELTHLLGLCWAWDGNDLAAAEALFQAARLYQDEVDALECETLAQFFNRTHPEHSSAVLSTQFESSSVARTLSLLDDAPQFVREEVEKNSRLMAAYTILDRPIPTGDGLANMTLETCPHRLGELRFFEGSDSPGEGRPTGPFAELAAIESMPYESCLALIEKHAPGLLKIVPHAHPTAGGEQHVVVMRQAKLVAELRPELYFPENVSRTVQSAIVDELWNQVPKKWLNTPLTALEGKTPLEAAGQVDLQRPLHAALFLLDHLYDVERRILPRAEFEQQLQLPPLPSVELSDDENVFDAISRPINRFRVNLSTLSDENLNMFIRFAEICRHSGLTAAGYREALSNERSSLFTDVSTETNDDHSQTEAAIDHSAHDHDCARDHDHDHDHDFDDEGDDLEEDSALMNQREVIGRLIDISLNDRNDEEAFALIERGRALPLKPGEDPFNINLNWTIQEFRAASIRSNEKLADVLKNLWDNFASKVPGMRSQLIEAASKLKIDPPWGSEIVTASNIVGSGSTNWSPSGTTPASEPKKLYIPGQD